MFDSVGLEVLTRAECIELLLGVSIGRIIYTDEAMPAIQPVNFGMLDNAVVIRTAPGSKLAAAARNAVVAFEADALSADLRTGWSVTVVGHASEVFDPAEQAALDGLQVRPWSKHGDHYIKIAIELVEGRRVPNPTGLPEKHGVPN